MLKQEAAPSLRLETILHALGDPVRLGIVRQLAREGESSCAALNGGRSKSTMSHHFRVLREAGLVVTRVQGVTHMNGLCRSAVEASFPGLLAAVIDCPVAGAPVENSAA
ncbi:helix-turn-helix domain-containing protein [Lichenihabitans sp. Uapishka_5]|uniref:ArsR/SmtB family transcription factor n=1 Tax=Lichenihabitans sp. Uapishka_5 TaxID=3037302 RepID=UPI0029E82594|nr:helix-turn-helix domain-containing protein [Lichenihabitans sp. Uapishka_5]MDX7950009.1 helix-turn-helix domain-containing protein [Lichenihabitans sp. Uapishka_5]